MAEAATEKKPRRKTEPEAKRKASANSPAQGEVWVIVEHEAGAAGRVSWELLGKARSLAATLGTRAAAVILSDSGQQLAQEAFTFGAAAVYLAEHSALNPFTTDPHCRALAALARKYEPGIILMGATTRGRDLASAVATDLETGLTADCTSLEIDEETGLLMQTRPAFGGNIMATIISPDTRPQMSTVRPGVFSLPDKQAGASGEIVAFKPKLAGELPVRQLEFVATPAKGVSLQGARAIIAGGRGMKKAENFAMLEELAAELGGVVAGSRGAVDAGWISAQRQVGQTGQTVRPVLYFAVGISGAIQHLAGMQESDVVVAINSDPEAPIFDVADFGIVGDLFEVLPSLIGEIKRRKAESGGPGFEIIKTAMEGAQE